MRVTESREKRVVGSPAVSFRNTPFGAPFLSIGIRPLKEGPEPFQSALELGIVFTWRTGSAESITMKRSVRTAPKSHSLVLHIKVFCGRNWAGSI